MQRKVRYSFGQFTIQSVREPVVDPVVCNSPDRLMQYWIDHIETSLLHQPDKELFAVVLFNTKIEAVGWHLVSLGSLNETCAHPREILRPVIVGAAHAFAMMHNHPSGCTDPSDADRRMTRRVREASEIIGINLMDHVIVGARPGMPHSYFSFREVGLI
jgi:DNA repair protein RadC